MVKDYKNDSWETFLEDMKNKDLYIWGAGRRGKEVMEKYASSWEIAGFIDNNDSMKEYMGYRVIHPNDFKGGSDECCILISTDDADAIVRQIHEMGIDSYYSYFWLNRKAEVYFLKKEIDEAKIESVKSLMTDERSKWLIDQIIEKRKNVIPDYMDIKEEGDEYFDHDFFTYSEKEVFVDAGGYDGDTIEGFVSFTKNRYKRIYSFEPDKNTGEVLKSKLYLYGDKVNFYPYGLWSKAITLPFCNDNQINSSHIVNDDTATSSISCVKLDDIVKSEDVTYIKMDIEGAEIPALHGAKNTILSNRPKLAICIYHKPKDLWEIPLLIHSWVPDYKFYIRHYGTRYFGTILFATI